MRCLSSPGASTPAVPGQHQSTPTLSHSTPTTVAASLSPAAVAGVSKTNPTKQTPSSTTPGAVAHPFAPPQKVPPLPKVALPFTSTSTPTHANVRYTASAAVGSSNGVAAAATAVTPAAVRPRQSGISSKESVCLIQGSPSAAASSAATPGPVIDLTSPKRQALPPMSSFSPPKIVSPASAAQRRLTNSNASPLLPQQQQLLLSSPQQQQQLRVNAAGIQHYITGSAAQHVSFCCCCCCF